MSDKETTAGQEPEVKTLTMEDLSEMISTKSADVVKAAIEELKTETHAAGRKNVFPGQDPDTGEMATGNDQSVIDTKYFFKSYQRGRLYGTTDDGTMLGKQLVNGGGPFLRLSPAMEMFAKGIACGWNGEKMARLGVDYEKYQETVVEGYKASGMSEGVAADGGVTVPIEFYTTIIEFATTQSPILSRIWRIPMGSNTMRFSRLVQAAGSYFGGIQLNWIDEAATKEDTKPTMEQITLTAKKLIGLVYMTDELIADSYLNIVNYVTGLFTRAFEYEMERVVISGNGTTQPLGIGVDTAINSVARATAGTVGFTDVIDMDSALDENFRDLTWLCRKTTRNTLSGLRDTNNRPIFYADYATFNNGTLQPPSMVGYPVYMTRNCPALGNNADLILGDLGMYMMGMRQNLTIDSSQHVKFTTDETTYRFVMRLDGRPAVSVAFAKLVGISS